MNSKLDFIFKRRSVRSYTDAPVTEPDIRDLLEAAMAAPSAVARDPWHFLVVRGREKRERIADALPNGKMTKDAPVAIVVLGDLDRAHDRQESYLLQDASAAVENLLLAATALGLGAVWLGVHPREERIARLRELFSLPDAVIPVAVIALGHPAEHPEPRTRYRDDAVHFESW